MQYQSSERGSKRENDVDSCAAVVVKEEEEKEDEEKEQYKRCLTCWSLFGAGPGSAKIRFLVDLFWRYTYVKQDYQFLRDKCMIY